MEPRPRSRLRAGRAEGPARLTGPLLQASRGTPLLARPHLHGGPTPWREADISHINPGDTAFVLLCAAQVAIMTPGLAFFYGGLVRHKNVITTMMQSVNAHVQVRGLDEELLG